MVFFMTVSLTVWQLHNISFRSAFYIFVVNANMISIVESLRLDSLPLYLDYNAPEWKK